MLAANSKIRELKFRMSVIALLAIYTGLFAITLNAYIHWQSVNFITGMLAVPVVANISTGVRSYRYGIVALLFGSIALLLPINTVLYFTFLFAFLCVIESFFGKINSLLLLILFFLSPIFQYFINVFSFPIRLQLTAWAGSIMNAMKMDSVIQGNIILYRGNEFSVDPACIGLNMLQLSLIASVVLMAHFQRKMNKKFSLYGVATVFTIVLFFNIIANLLRIVCMVQFTILPETILHDITGLIFFLVYIILPLHFIVKKIALGIQLKKEAENTSPKVNISVKKLWLVNSILILMLSASSFRNMELKDKPVDSLETTTVKGYSVQFLPHQVLKLENKSSLVYIKRIPAFYNADHTPYICWSGSGYSFQNIEKQLIGSYTVYAGKLTKDKDKLFTAWWYQNKSNCTVNQITWRWDMLRGKGNYYVVNVTATTREALKKEIMEVLNNHPFIQLLN
jgi:exosortase N